MVRIVNSESESFITEKQMNDFEERYEKVSLATLLRHKIVRELDDVYEINKSVVDFISFCNNEYALSSPESVKGHHFPLNEVYEKLLRASESNERIRFANQLISQLRDFSDALFSTTERLLQETLELKENSEHTHPKERFDRASLIIKEYVEPLNEMIEDRENTILPLVRNISSLAMQLSGDVDYLIANVMRNLWLQANRVHKDTERFGKQVIDELFTLKKIQKTSATISGAIAWLENIDKLEPKVITDEYKMLIHSKEFFFETINELEELLLIDETITVPISSNKDKDKKSYFHFNKNLYMKQLKNDLPIDNIFYWIYEILEENNELNYQNYCEALTLLDAVNLKYSRDRSRIDFDEFYLDIPIVIAKNIKNMER
jgi:hypothetical protein